MISAVSTRPGVTIPDGRGGGSAGGGNRALESVSPASSGCSSIDCGKSSGGT